METLQVTRQCGDCTRCCEGWLEGTVFGQPMYPGKKCFYLEKTCSIYCNRPEDPCREYTCAWIEHDVFPMWLKPNLSNIIISEKVHPGRPELTYFDITETGQKMDSSVLNWLVHWSLKQKKNIIYQINGKQHILGSAEFTQALANLAN